MNIDKLIQDHYKSTSYFGESLFDRVIVWYERDCGTVYVHAVHPIENGEIEFDCRYAIDRSQNAYTSYTKDRG